MRLVISNILLCYVNESYFCWKAFFQLYLLPPSLVQSGVKNFWEWPPACLTDEYFSRIPKFVLPLGRYNPASALVKRKQNIIFETNWNPRDSYAQKQKNSSHSLRKHDEHAKITFGKDKSQKFAKKVKKLKLWIIQNRR